MKVGSNKKIEKIICRIGYILVPVFFILLYTLMTETYEDIMQGNLDAAKSIGDIIVGVYNYIPRIGEFYQRIAAHYMTPQVSFGPDLFFRLLTAAIASGVVYFSTIFVLKRKPQLKYADVYIYLGILLFLMISIFSEAFTYRFSYVNNYGLGLLALVVFLALFRLENLIGNKWWKILGIIIIGFCFGISTEIAPVVAIIIIGCWFVIKLCRKTLHLTDLFTKYRVQTCATIGLILGLIFFYLLGNGLSGRTSGAYAEVYNYISLKSIFHTPIETLYSLVSHVWYNIRYVFFAFPLMLTFIFVESNVYKDKEMSFWQTILLISLLLFIGATSLIKVHDDLYPRFMVPAFIIIVLSMALFIYHTIKRTKISDKKLKCSSIVVVSAGTVLVLDMSFAFIIYNRTVAPMLDAIHYNPGESLIIDHIENDYTMTPSPIFRLKELPPFDWGSGSSEATKFKL